MKLVALVPMRHHSERVPGKNYRMFGDAPLFHHIVRTLLSVDRIDEIIIDTDSPVVAEQCSDAFPEVRLLERPEHLRDGSIPMTEIILHDLAQTDADVILQTHSTNPLLEGKTIEAAINAYGDGSVFDSVFTVTALQARLWTGAPAPVNHDPGELKRTQDLEPLYIENSCAFVFGRSLIESTGRRIGERPTLVEMDPAEAQDIDVEADFLVAEAIWTSRQGTIA